jgi:putative ABC transport system substrate-binding protein
MNRRELLLGGVSLGSAAAADASFPHAALAAPRSKIRRLGFLTTSAGPALRHRALDPAALGYQEGYDLIVERRYAGGQLDRLPALAAELVRAKVEVIVTEATPAALAARTATSRIPIVMATSGDPVAAGLVASLARPDGNVTGLSFVGPELGGKRVQLLRELKPNARRIAHVGNREVVPEYLTFIELRATAASLGMDALFFHVPNADVLESTFASMVAAEVDVAFVTESAILTDARGRIVELAARYRLPVAYGRREFVDAGGLVSYGTSFKALFRRAATFVDNIFKGASPAELPVQQPRNFELVINLNAAKALGLSVPLSLLLRADEMIA